LGEVVLGEEHVPETHLLGLDLELLDHGGGGLPSLFALAELGREEGFGGDTVLFDEFFDLESESIYVRYGLTEWMDG
jgi:hypothetical protein